MTGSDGKGQGKGGAALGVLLILLGTLFLVEQLIDLSFIYFTWPLFILAPGAFLVFMGLLSKNGSVNWMVISGSLAAVTGLILLYQNSTGHWQSWAYVWPLIFPGSVGAGKLISGLVKGREDEVKSGRGLLLWGAIIFFAGLAFFEFVVGISGYGIKNIGRYWPVILIVLGIWIIFNNIRSWK
ncbi:MAG: hypothetical protein ACOY46_12805 [Bacillota bacterium]